MCYFDRGHVEDVVCVIAVIWPYWGKKCFEIGRFLYYFNSRQSPVIIHECIHVSILIRKRLLKGAK